MNDTLSTATAHEMNQIYGHRSFNVETTGNKSLSLVLFELSSIIVTCQCGSNLRPATSDNGEDTE